MKIKTNTLTTIRTEMDTEQEIIDVPNAMVETPLGNPLESTIGIAVLERADAKAVTPKATISIIILITTVIKTRETKIRHQVQKSLSQNLTRKVQKNTPLTLDSLIQGPLVHW